MKITTRQLRRIIREEKNKLAENEFGAELDHLESNIDDDEEHEDDLERDIELDRDEEERAHDHERGEERHHHHESKKISYRGLRRMIRESLPSKAALVVNYGSSGMSYTDPATGRVVTPEDILDYGALGDAEFMKQSGEMVAAAADKAGITQIDDAERGMMSVDEFVNLMSSGGDVAGDDGVPGEETTADLFKRLGL